MRRKVNRIFAADFETTVYEGQTRTDVWASACVELHTEDVHIYNCIEDFVEYILSINDNTIVYFHNLKFDGTFLLHYFLVELKWKQACKVLKESPIDIEWERDSKMKNNTIKYMISNMGQWYHIVLKHNGYIIQFRDSYKLLPFSLEKIGESFGTKHKKLSMEYKGYRQPHGTIADNEKEYIANDVLVLKEGLEIMFNDGHDNLTIGACCLSEFKRGYHYTIWNDLFPNLYEIEIDENLYGSPNAGAYIHKSYRGGWCYVTKRAKNIVNNGVTADVNSLYPSVMHSISGNVYPVGKPSFYKPDNLPCNWYSCYYFIRLKTRFKLKPNKLPFIQIKNSFMYKSTEMLTTSDVYNKKDGEYYTEYIDVDNNIVQARPELTMTKTDYLLFKEHYDLYDTEILDVCIFGTEIGLFDEYIDKYKKIKMENKGAVREEAKLFLNNLYGKMATGIDSSFKYALIKDGKVIFVPVRRFDKKPGYIAIGSAITSYARNFTIRAAQMNYYGDDENGFIYADTDSIHCDLPIDKIRGINIHDTEFCCWKIEGEWDIGLFVRQKTYIEHIVRKDGKDVKPYYDVKCAGMPKKCKDLFLKSMSEDRLKDLDKYTKEEVEFLMQKQNTLKDFDVGLKVPGKLMPTVIVGGTLLVDTSYEMR